MPKTSVTSALIAIDVDRSSKIPAYLQIARLLRQAIEDGSLAPGLKLPSTRILARQLDVSRNTAMQAFETLIGEGLLTGQVGSGTFVSKSRGEKPFQQTDPAAKKGDYPFRSLSSHGRRLLASATGAFSERPIPFMPDLPDLREFPIRTWLRLLNEASGRLTGEILFDSPIAGYEPLRRAVAQYLNAFLHMTCDYEQVIITTGSHQSLDLACRLLIDPGDPVWVEDPGYVGAQGVIGANGGVIYPIPIDEEGMTILKTLETSPAPRLAYVSSSRHYPLGPTLSMRRREELLHLSQSCGAWIIEDNYDHEFLYSGPILPSIFGMDSGKRTIHIGTFSKALLPSFRLGYVVVPKDFADAFAKARAIVDRHASLIEQMVLSEFMQRGLFAAHIRRMRELYRARQQFLVSGLKRLFGDDIAIGSVNAGIHIVLPLPPDIDDVLMVKKMARAGVVARALSPYCLGHRQQKGLLLGFAAFTEAEIAKGLELLFSVFKENRLELAKRRPAV